MPSALSAISDFLLAGANRAGMINLVKNSEWRRERPLILCYHGFSKRDEHLWSDLFVSASWFRARMALLKREGYEIITLDNLSRFLAGEPIPERAVVVTVDDGFHDFLEIAHPILQQESIPATLYVTTYYVEKQGPVFDPALSYLLWKGAGKPFILPWEKQTFIAPAADDQQGRHLLHSRLREDWKTLKIDATEKQASLISIGESFGVDMDSFMAERLFGLLTPDEVLTCSKSGVDIQLHTHRHRVPDDADTFAKEVEDNQRALEIMISPGAKLSHFCYPSGEYYSSSVKTLSSRGIATATTCDFGYAKRTSNPLLLPRLLDSMSISDQKFLAWLSGIMALRY